MTKREYYHERHGSKRRLSFDDVKKLFLILLTHKFHVNNGPDYFYYAKVRVWKPTPEAYILTNLGLDNVWPIEKHIRTYSRVDTLFTIMEFLFDHIADTYHIGESWGNNRIVEEAKLVAQHEYAKELNPILNAFGNGYQLSQNGEIQELAQEGFDHLTQDIPVTTESENVDSKVHYAIAKFLRYNSSLEEKKEAIRTLADVMEYLKDCDIHLDTKDESDLFRIFNEFSIRHHNKSQKVEYASDDFYRLTFFVLLANVRFLMNRIAIR